MSVIDLIPMPESIKRISSNDDRVFAWRFFIFFSRFEFALKRQRKYLKIISKTRNDAQPDWDKFAKDHASKFKEINNDTLYKAVHYFCSTPPKKQINANGTLGWSDEKSTSSEQVQLKWLLTMVRRVRNNLFHGGKFIEPIDEPSRDQTLIKHSIVILNACLPLNDKIMDSFNEEFR